MGHEELVEKLRNFQKTVKPKETKEGKIGLNIMYKVVLGPTGVSTMPIATNFLTLNVMTSGDGKKYFQELKIPENCPECKTPLSKDDVLKCSYGFGESFNGQNGYCYICKKCRIILCAVPTGCWRA